MKTCPFKMPANDLIAAAIIHAPDQKHIGEEAYHCEKGGKRHTRLTACKTSIREFRAAVSKNGSFWHLALTMTSSYRDADIAIGELLFPVHILLPAQVQAAGPCDLVVAGSIDGNEEFDCVDNDQGAGGCSLSPRK